jgi:membrane associated rhomboid family serine protease
MIPIRSTERTYSKPTAVVSLIVINILIFLYEITMDPYTQTVFIERWGIVPDTISQHLYTLVTSMFLHGGWLHVLGNMLYLWVFGRAIEDLIGSVGFLALYFCGGLAAGVLQVVTSPYSSLPTIGASGAIAGIMGAYMIKFSRSRIVTLVFIVIFFTTVEIPAWVMLIWWFVIQLFNGFGSLASENYSGGGTAWFAHVGGFLAGMLLIRVFPVKQRRWRPWHEED